MTFHSLTLLLHVSAGTLALATFWLAALLRKGSLLHRRSGQVYLLAMAAVVVSGIPITWRAWQMGNVLVALFLAFLLLLVTTSCWTAWRAIRDKHDVTRFTGPVWRGLQLSTTLAGIALMIAALTMWQPLSLLVAAFGSIGLLTGHGAWKLWRHGPQSPRWWLQEHYAAMIGNGVATHIAFLSIGLRSVIPDLPAVVATYLSWMLPLAAGGLAGWWLDRRYGRGATRPGRVAARR